MSLSQPHGTGKYSYDVGCHQNGDYVIENQVCIICTFMASFLQFDWSMPSLVTYIILCSQFTCIVYSY